MKLIIDANELFSFFNAKSKTRELALLSELELFSPKFALVEIRKYGSEIKKRFKLDDFQFETITNFMETIVKFRDVEDYVDKIDEAKVISPDPNDIDYFALALKLSCPIWSEDKELKKQKMVKVISTSELISLLS